MRKQYKLILFHLGFWTLNYLYVTGGNLGWNGFVNSDGTLPLAYSYGMFFNAALFYLQVFWLVPKYFIKKKKANFWILSLSILVGITMIETFLDLQVADQYEVYKGTDIPLFVFAIPWFYHNIVFHILYSLVGFFYQFFFEYRRAESAKKELLKETHRSELKYLKAQLNPHFLFNGINSVYHLIGRNDEIARETLMQFSGLLRYQLYESSETYIDLYKELEYVTQYVQMEEVRKGDDIDLLYDIEFDNGSQKIAPLLLTPFIENAFKYVSNHKESSKNIIRIEVFELEKELRLNVENSVDPYPASNTVGGVGLTNVKRRLELLYPDKHSLTAQKKSDRYFVDLKIDLS